MSDVTPHLGLPLLAAGQAQKHVTHNEALTLLDALAQLAAGRDAAGHAALAAEVQHAFGLAHANGWWRAAGDAG